MLEEAGIALTDVRYRGSQSWPYPRSLMLGFHATAVPGAEARGDGEEIVDVRWFARDELAEAFAAQAQDAAGGAGFALPGPASIAHRLILDWVERSA